MVNATAMAKVYNKLPKDFTKLEATQAFLKVLDQEFGDGFQGADSPLETSKYKVQEDDYPLETGFIPSENILKVIHGGRNNGTWMHELLAMDFAAWLNPHFKMWIYKTILDLRKGVSAPRIESATQITGWSDLKNQIFALNQEIGVLKKNLQKTTEAETLTKKQKELASLKTRLSVLEKNQLGTLLFKELPEGE